MKQFEKMSGNAQEKLKTLIGSNDNPSSMFKSPCFATSVNDDFNKLNLSLHQKKRGRPPLSNQSRKSTKQNDERSQKCDNPQCIKPKHSGKHKLYKKCQKEPKCPKNNGHVGRCLYVNMSPRRISQLSSEPQLSTGPQRSISQLSTGPQREDAS